MCVASGTAMLVSTIVGAALGGAGAYYSAESSRQQASAAADAASRNAEAVLAQEQAYQRQSEYDRLSRARQALQQKGEAMAQFGASGVALGSGTPSDYLADVASAYDIDYRTMAANDDMNLYSLEVQRANYLNEAAANKAAASRRNVAIGTTFGTISGALSGLSTGAGLSQAFGLSAVTGAGTAGTGLAGQSFVSNPGIKESAKGLMTRSARYAGYK